MTRLNLLYNDTETRLFISGRLDAKEAAKLWSRAATIKAGQRSDILVMDFKEMTYLDTAGAALICRFQDFFPTRGFAAVRLAHISKDHQALVASFKDAVTVKNSSPKTAALSAVEKIGSRLTGTVSDTKAFITYTGRIAWALLQSAKHPLKIRWADTFMVAEKSGVDALPIVALISFIVGLVMAFQAAIPMRMFGAELYVANLIGISMVRELAPLMTAIVLAGRSASAFAAEIGTMQINEEIDALDVMGIDPFRFLIVPRIIASTCITPLLTIFSNLMGMLGGALVITAMGYPIVSYYQQIADFVKWNDFAGGMVKCFVFGILIAATGCIRGIQTTGGPSAVGVATTMAVVTSIVLIAVFDGIFSIIYYTLGI